MPRCRTTRVLSFDSYGRFDLMYCFSYQGELVDGADKAKVIVNLARLFSITEEQVTQLFEVDREFVREGLDQSTAHDYLTVFNRAGARGHVNESIPKIDAKERATDNPASLSDEQQRSGDSPANIADSSSERVSELQRDDGAAFTSVIEQKMQPRVDSQIEYGSHVMKHLKAGDESDTSQQSGEPNTSELATDKPRPKRQQLQHNKKSATARWLRIGSIAIVGTIIADEQLQSALIIDRFGFDIGYWPLILAHIPLIIGCYLLAREKRLSPIFGVLGLLSFAGLSVLLLMRAKGAQDHKISLGAVAMTVFSCGVFIYWFGGALQTSVDTQGLYDRLAILRDAREEFPSTQTQGELELYSSEQSELYQTMTDIITLANSDELRPDQTTELSNAMMNEVARYIAWRQYQQFLHRTNNLVLPDGLDRKFQKADESKIGGRLRGITPQSNKRLYESVMSWTVAPLGDAEYAKTSGLRRQLDQIFDAVQDGWLAQTDGGRDKADSESSDMPPVIDVAILKLPDLNGAELVKRKNHVEYVFTTGSLSGKTLAVGFYTVKNQPRWNRKVSYSPRYKLLNSDVPAIYMSNLISVFDRYAKPVF